MRIIVDENIPLGRETFAVYGEVDGRPGRGLDAAAVRDADVLVVRSVTRVGEDLLGGSRARFVGSATIGTDHVDLAYLARRGITFAHAPGCNARSVAEYVTAALLELEEGGSYQGETIGVVGVGNVGSRVVAMARALGLRVLECDPPRAEREGDGRFAPLERLLEEAAILTLHVPLERGGAYPTHHLIDGAALARLPRGAVVINTSRGGVVDDGELRAACSRGDVVAVLDVWEGEPEPPPDLVAAVRLATPHVAGYSLDGKLAGTRMIAQALHAFLGAGGVPAGAALEGSAPRVLVVGGGGRDAVRRAVRAAYDIRADDRRTREALSRDADRAAAFDRLRRDYPVRREFPNYVVRGDALAPADRALLAALGFAPAASDPPR